MERYLHVCLTLVILLNLANPVTGVQCYECDSRIKSECGQQFGLTSSSSAYIVDNCARCLTKIERSANNSTIYSRECSAASLNDCRTISSSEQQCFCDTDLCNSSCHVTVAISSIIISFLFTFLIH